MDGQLASFMTCAARLLASGGAITLIWRADGLAYVLDSLGGFGAITLMPVHPRADAPAHRLLLRAVKASRAPLTLLPALTLNDADGRPTAAAEAVLRHGEPIRL